MLFRWLAELLVVVLIITVLRSVIGVVMKILGGVFGAPAPPKTAQTPRRPDVPAGGELKKDPYAGHSSRPQPPCKSVSVGRCITSVPWTAGTNSRCEKTGVVSALSFGHECTRMNTNPRTSLLRRS